MDTSAPGSSPDDRYEFVRRIARGGGGTVWRAHDRVLAREIAIKQVEIPEELTARESSKQRVLREAKAAARLRHPGVVTVYDVLDGGDHVHLVMELVDAPTLRDVVADDGPLDDATAAGMGLALLDVLHAAHQHGIVHRDLKPSNVFLHPNGTVQLADFGIASVAGETSLTVTGTALGSPDYIAPEQAQGAPPASAADLWGLGVTLYHAVEGVPPFERAGLIPTVQAVVNDPYRPFTRADSLRRVIDALLRKDPGQRPSAEEVRPQLEEVAAATAPPHPPPDADTRSMPAVVDATPPIGGPGPGTDPDADADASPATTPAATADPTPDDADTFPQEGTPPPPSSPSQNEDIDAGTDGPTSSRRAMAVAAVLGVVALAGLVTWVGTDDPATDPEVAEAPDEDGDADGDAGSGDGGQDGSGVPDGDEADGDGDEGGDVDEPTPIDEADEVPADWQTMQGSTYQVAVPASWQQRQASGNRTDYVEPDTGAYLRVDHTDDPAPDPLADWEAAAADFAQRHDGYEELRLEPVSYREYDAAIWEYRYDDGGTTLRAVNLNIVDGDHAYALNLQSPADDWDAVGAHLPHVTAGFTPDR
jgi:eukaryotic-like serine/threonine-protein kinase